LNEDREVTKQTLQRVCRRRILYDTIPKSTAAEE
jgi:hypothetical protein